MGDTDQAHSQDQSVLDRMDYLGFFSAMCSYIFYSSSISFCMFHSSSFSFCSFLYSEAKQASKRKERERAEAALFCSKEHILVSTDMGLSCEAKQDDSLSHFVIRELLFSHNHPL